MFNIKEIEQSVKLLSHDIYENPNFTHKGKSGNEAMQAMINLALGQDKNETKIHYSNWRQNKNNVFAIIEVALDTVLPGLIDNKLRDLAEVHTIATGDQAKFSFDDNSLFRVGLVASGDGDLHRQELVGGSYTVKTDWYGVAIYTELERFLSGAIKWNDLIDRVALSFEGHLNELIYTAFSESYDGLRSTRKVEGAYDEDKLLELTDHISVSAGNVKPVIYGTRTALRKISRQVGETSDGMRDEMNKVGFLGTLAGIDLIALPNAYKAGTEEFAIDNDTLIVLPENEKTVTVVLEGDALAQDNDIFDRHDLQKEFKFLKKLGVQVAQSSVYGIYKINA